MIAFVWHELTTENPMVDLRILKNRQLAVGVVFGSMLGFALYASVFALPVFLQNYLGFSAWDTGTVILPGAIATAVTMAVVGRLANKVDVRPIIFTGVRAVLPARCGCTRTSRSRSGRSTCSGR